MSWEEFLGKEKPLAISYSIQSAPIGRVLIASTPKGICFIMPAAMKWEPEATLKRHFPKARFRNRTVALHKKALLLLRRRDDKVPSLCLHQWHSRRLPVGCLPQNQTAEYGGKIQRQDRRSPKLGTDAVLT